MIKVTLTAEVSRKTWNTLVAVHTCTYRQEQHFCMAGCENCITCDYRFNKHSRDLLLADAAIDVGQHLLNKELALLEDTDATD